MGNTKIISFEGQCTQENVENLTREKILKCCHGSYCAIEVDEKGYLECGKGVYIIGVVHTYSMCGIDLVKHLETYMIDPVIMYLDQDYPEMLIAFNAELHGERILFKISPENLLCGSESVRQLVIRRVNKSLSGAATDEDEKDGTKGNPR